MTAEDVAKVNLFKPTRKVWRPPPKLYGYHCAMCHGKNGDGKGELAAEMKLDLHDWRDPKSIANIPTANSFTSSATLEERCAAARETARKR